MSEEVWKDVVGYEDRYHGKIKYSKGFIFRYNKI